MDPCFVRLVGPFLCSSTVLIETKEGKGHEFIVGSQDLSSIQYPAQNQYDI